MLFASVIVFVCSHVYRPVSLVAEILNIDKQILLTVSHIESNHNRKAISPKGAIGVMQVMPSNLKAFRADTRSTVENIMAGAILLKQYLRAFDNDLILSLAAYNAGPRAVKKYKGVPPFPETQNYIKKFLIHYKKNIYKEKISRSKK